MRRLSIAALLTIGCAPTPPSLTVEVTPGQESDAFSRAPVVDRFVVRAVNASGAAVATVSSEPGGGFSLGELAPDALLRVEVEGRDSGGEIRVRGSSLAVVLGAAVGNTLPVFAQRLGEFARPPSGLLHGFVRPAAVSLGERYLLATGGTGPNAARTGYYDLLSLTPAVGGTLPRVARTLVPAATGAAILVIGPRADGDPSAIGASWIDFDEGTVTDATLPDGLDSFASVADGSVVTTPEGAAYVVGGSRRDGASDRVLAVSATRALSAIHLVAPRRGAAAVWLAESGLVVVGGSASAPGVETLAPGATAFVARTHPPDPTEGAAAVTSGNGEELVLVGGTDAGAPAATRLIVATCSSSCAPKVLHPEGLGMPLQSCRAFALGNDHALSVCAHALTSEVLVHRLAMAAGTVEPVPLREPRRDAASLATPLGTLAILGGTRMSDDAPALSVETWLGP